MKIKSFSKNPKYYITVFLAGLFALTTLLSVGFGALNSSITIAGNVTYEKDKGNMIKAYTSSSTSDFHSDTYKNKITTIDFMDNNTVPNNAVISWDVSANNSGRVMAWLINDPNNSGYYKLYIGGTNGFVYANTNSSYLFYHFENVKSINFNNHFDTSEVTQMHSMFSSCKSLTTLDLSSFNTSKVTDMSAMFQICQKLTSLNISSFDTSNVTSMSYMFNYCEKLTSINVGSFNTAKVTNMSMMFDNCNSLSSIDLSSFNTSSVTDMRSMFDYCNNLTMLDLRSFNTSRVTDMRQMFAYCSKLMRIKISSTWSIESVTNGDGMFLYDSKLPNFDSNYVGSAKAIPTTQGGYLTLQSSDNLLKVFSYSSTEAFHSSDYATKITSIIFKDSKTVASNAVTSWDVSANGNNSVKAWITNDPNNSGYYILYIGADGVVSANPDSSNLFRGLEALKSVTFDNNFDTSMVTKMGSMFSSCKSLTTLDLSSFNTSKVTNMSAMFQLCQNLTTLNVSSFDTRNVTDMSYMFSYCEKLTTLNVSNFNTSKVKNMFRMFSSCYKVTSLNLSNFDTSQVTDMAGMFSSNQELTTLNLSSFNTSQVTRMYQMFMGCSKITNLNVSSFNTSQVTDMSGMFSSMSNIESIDIRSFNTSNVTNMSIMFRYDYKLTTIKISSNWSTSSVNNGTDMFLSSTLLPNFNANSVDVSMAKPTTQGGYLTLAGSYGMFSYESIDYQFEIGMSWSDWIESNYNTDGFSNNSNYVVDSNNEYVTKNGRTREQISDMIYEESYYIYR